MELGSILLEISLHGFLLSVRELAVLVCVELLHELGLHLSLLLLAELGAAGGLRSAAAGTLRAALVELGSILLEISLHGFLLSIGKLAILVCVELLHELGLHLSLASLVGSLALILRKLAVLVSIELGEHLSLAGLELGLHLGLLLLAELGAVHLLGAAGAGLTAFGHLGAFLSQQGHGCKQGN